MLEWLVFTSLAIDISVLIFLLLIYITDKRLKVINVRAKELSLNCIKTNSFFNKHVNLSVTDHLFHLLDLYQYCTLCYVVIGLQLHSYPHSFECPCSVHNYSVLHVLCHLPGCSYRHMRCLKGKSAKIFPLSLWNHPLVCLAACFSAHLLTLHLCFCVISFFLCSACLLFWSRIMYRTYRMWVPSPPPSYLHTFVVRLWSNACKSYN